METQDILYKEKEISNRFIKNSEKIYDVAMRGIVSCAFSGLIGLAFSTLRANESVELTQSMRDGFIIGGRIITYSSLALMSFFPIYHTIKTRKMKKNYSKEIAQLTERVE